MAFRLDGIGAARYTWSMTTDPQSPYADPADVAAQHQDVVPLDNDEDVADLGRAELPLEADDADVAEQRTDVPGWVDDEDGDH